MAISQKNLSISGVQSIINAGHNAYSRIMQEQSKVEGLKNILNHLLILIQQAEANEQRLCQLAGCGNIQELIQKINIFMSKSGANNFTGLNLNKLFVEEFGKVAKNLRTEEDKEIAALGQHIINQIQGNQGVLNTRVGETLEQSFLRYFHESLVTGVITTSGTKIDFRSRTLKEIIDWSNNTPRFMLEEITPTIRERLLNIINTEKMKNYPMLEDIHITRESISGNTLTFDFKSEWFNLTKGMTEAEIQKQISKNPQVWIPIRDKANKTLINRILSATTSYGSSYFKTALDKMLTQNPNMFFVGKATTEITGLLGELSTYAMLHEVFGEKANMLWTAQMKGGKGNKKISIDLILEGFGIQVKNTTQDLSNLSSLNIDFVNRSASDVIQQLLGAEGSEALGAVFESSYFNISYQIMHHSKPHVVPGSNAEFDGIQAELVSLRDSIKQLLLMYSPQLLYMANNAGLTSQLATLTTQLEKINGNTLYMIGNQPVFMSEMLRRVETQIRQLISFYEGTSFGPTIDFLTISGNGETIVSFLNKRAAQKELIGLERQGFLGNQIHGTRGLKKTVQLTTSFNFH